MTALWKEEPLGAVCQFINRGVSPSYLESGGVVVLNQKCVRDHRISYEPGRRHDVTKKRVTPERFIRAGDVLVNSTGTGTLGRVAQMREAPPEPTTVDSHVTIVRPAEGLFVPEFFGYALIAVEDQIKEGGEGCGGQTELSRSKLAETYRIRFPTDRNTQRRIVAILDDAFEAIATAKTIAEKNVRNARELFGSRLDNIFGTDKAGWIERPLDEICGRITDGEHLRPKMCEVGVPFLSAKDVRDDGVVFGESLFVSEDDAQKFRRRCNPERGDILIVSRGATVGRTCVVETDRVFCLLGSVILLKLKTGLASRFVAYALKSTVARRNLMSASEASAQQAIYLRDIKPLKIKTPPLHQQVLVADALDALSEELNSLEEIIQRKLAALNELRQSLLNQAFAGALTGRSIDQQLAEVA